MNGRKRVGRGYGSGKGGHTSGRGQKGQRSRRTIPWSFEGGALALNRRMPFVRGKGRLNVLFAGPAVINVGQLEKFATGTVITTEFLVKERLVHEEDLSHGVKVLGRGKLSKKLTVVGLTVSMPAKVKIEKAGGEIQETMSKKQKATKEQTEEAVEKTPVKKVVKKTVKKLVKKNVKKTSKK